MEEIISNPGAQRLSHGQHPSTTSTPPASLFIGGPVGDVRASPDAKSSSIPTAAWPPRRWCLSAKDPSKSNRSRRLRRSLTSAKNIGPRGLATALRKSRFPTPSASPEPHFHRCPTPSGHPANLPDDRHRQPSFASNFDPAPPGP